MDRSLEFKRLVNDSSSSSSAKKPEIPRTRSAFNEAASDIARGIHRSSTLLTKLTKLVKNQGLFDDDASDEVSTLILRLKQDISELNIKCDSAQQYLINNNSSKTSSNEILGNLTSTITSVLSGNGLGYKSQVTIHGTTVVQQLKTELMETTKGFKDVMELRSNKMKDQQQRKVQLIGQSNLTPLKQPAKQSINGASHAVSHNLFPSPYSAKVPIYGDAEAANHEIQQEQQLLLAPPTSNALNYYESRERAVTEVEKTIGELGQLFQRLGTMIASQQELVERIDEDIESAVSNTDRARDVLSQAYEKISSNQGLAMKVSAILIIFVIFFILFLM